MTGPLSGSRAWLVQRLSALYLLGFLLVGLLGEYRRRQGRLPVGRDALGDLFFYGMMGAIVGA